MRKFVDQSKVEFFEECDETVNALTNHMEAECHVQGETPAQQPSDRC